MAGSVNDAKAWNRSALKREFQSQDEFVIIADKIYGLTKHLLRPFKENELSPDQRLKKRQKRFNYRLNSLRTLMTEHIYGVWKNREAIQ